jgi:hypothetical protein
MPEINAYKILMGKPHRKQPLARQKERERDVGG